MILILKFYKESCDYYNIKDKISVIKISEIYADLPITFENLRKTLGDFRKSSEGFGSSSSELALFGNPQAIFGNLLSNFALGKMKLTKNALCPNQNSVMLPFMLLKPGPWTTSLNGPSLIFEGKI